MFCLMFRPLVKKNQQHSYNYHGKEGNKGGGVYNFRINIFPADLIGIVFYERVRKICFTKLCFNFPLPVGYRAVAPAKPDSKDKPRKGGCCNGYQVDLSCPWPYPAKKIETDQGKMSKREKYVKEFKQRKGVSRKERKFFGKLRTKAQ